MVLATLSLLDNDDEDSVQVLCLQHAEGSA